MCILINTDLTDAEFVCNFYHFECIGGSASHFAEGLVIKLDSDSHDLLALVVDKYFAQKLGLNAILTGSFSGVDH